MVQHVQRHTVDAYIHDGFALDTATPLLNILACGFGEE